jgi:hypothetical protein
MLVQESITARNGGAYAAHHQEVSAIVGKLGSGSQSDRPTTEE